MRCGVVGERVGPMIRHCRHIILVELLRTVESLLRVQHR